MRKRSEQVRGKGRNERRRNRSRHLAFNSSIYMYYTLYMQHQTVFSILSQVLVSPAPSDVPILESSFAKMCT